MKIPIPIPDPISKFIVENPSIGVNEVGGISGPVVLSDAGIEDVKVGREIVPEVSITFVINRGRAIQPVNFPVPAPVSRLRHRLYKFGQEVAVDIRQAENIRTNQLMGNIPQTEIS